MNVLVTGGAGFIGSNLVAELIASPTITKVRVLDNLCTGSIKNIEEYFSVERFEFIEGDIRDFETCLKSCEDIDIISHQAALGSVPRSINDPLTTNEVNITGTLNMFSAAKDQKVQRVVYAASSSTYGDHPSLPKKEPNIGNPLSPYAVTKYVNELYARVYANVYGLELIGLRYFNVFGPKQNPQGPYAAVIPLFIKAVLDNEPPLINGDGAHSRDFTYVGNAVRANMLAMFSKNLKAINEVYNVACGEQTTLNELFDYIKEIGGSDLAPKYGPERKGDVKHSLADISKIEKLLGYTCSTTLKEGLKTTFEWYRKQYHFAYS
ncbi:MAG: SDR family oxidoreductase [Candidatus Dadabacteria bacterium]